MDSANKSIAVPVISNRKASTSVMNQVATYPCPFCEERMYQTQEIDFGTVMFKDGVRAPAKYHRACKSE